MAQSQNQGGGAGTKSRGFAKMDPQKQREIASKGGRAAHERGTAHEVAAGDVVAPHRNLPRRNSRSNTRSTPAAPRGGTDPAESLRTSSLTETYDLMKGVRDGSA